MNGSIVLSMYLALSWVVSPIYRLLLQRRLKAGKEVAGRIHERFGDSGLPRPDGPLIWMHAASIGETQSLLGLIPALLAKDAELSILVTSTTATSARLLERDLPARAMHQFSPIDTPGAVRRFLDHWKPSVAVWVESEIWPRMLVETKARGIPMMLINARVSTKTIERYKWAARTARALFSKFDRILAQDQKTFELLEGISLNGPSLHLTGSLKEELAPQLKPGHDLDALRSAISGRRVWVAASTHPGEEDVLLNAHRLVGDDALLILVPRHPERGDALMQDMRDAGWKVAQRSKGEAIKPDAQLYLADTIGEMGLWYRLSEISFIAGSIANIGGHNPFEPILLNSAVISGSQVGNFSEVYAALDRANAAMRADTDAEISEAVITLFDKVKRSEQVARARAYLASQASITPQVRDHILDCMKQSEKALQLS